MRSRPCHITNDGILLSSAVKLNNHEYPKYMFLKIDRHDITNDGRLLSSAVKLNKSLKLKANDGGKRCYHLVSLACFKDQIGHVSSRMNTTMTEVVQM